MFVHFTFFSLLQRSFVNLARAIRSLFTTRIVARSWKADLRPSVYNQRPCRLRVPPFTSNVLLLIRCFILLHVTINSSASNFTIVGSEEARRNASLRPPLKLDMQFYRIQLSRRCRFPRCNRRNQSNQVHQPEFTIELGVRQTFPACTTPTLKFMRPNAPYNPPV